MDKDTGIWGEKEVKKGYQCDRVLPGLIARCFPEPKSVADLGCGRGHYTRIFKSFGWPVVHGYEGSMEAINEDFYLEIIEMDLSKPLGDRTIRLYDLVICLEVGEHIPKQREQTFIDNICLFADNDLVLSWAVPGQGGRGHFNEQPNEYIINEMKKRHFKYNEKWSLWLREHVFFKFFKNTLMVFKREK
jgi:hypothetical protein